MNKYNTGEIPYDDLLFEGRNKRYGAYWLRHKYTRHATIGLVIALGIFIFLVFGPYVLGLLHFGSHYRPEDQSVLVDLSPPPPSMNMEYLPPPPSMPEAPKNIPPKITKDSIAEPEKKKPDVKDTTKSIVKTDTKTGGGEESNTNGNGMGEDPNQVYIDVDEPPQFPDGKLGEYLTRNIRYPQDEMIRQVQGRVLVSFIVEKDGSLKDIKIEHGISPGIDAEALRVVRAMPNWIPGKRKSQPVRVYVRLPVTFRLKR